MRRKTDGINQDPNGVVSPKENAWEMYLLIFWTIEPLCQLLHTGNDTKNICLHRIVTDTFLVYLYPFLLYHTWNKWNVLPWRVLRPPNNGTNSQGRIKCSPFSWVICRIVVPSEFMSFLFVLFLLTCCFMYVIKLGRIQNWKPHINAGIYPTIPIPILILTYVHVCFA